MRGPLEGDSEARPSSLSNVQDPEGRSGERLLQECNAWIVSSADPPANFVADFRAKEAAAFQKISTLFDPLHLTPETLGLALLSLPGRQRPDHTSCGLLVVPFAPPPKLGSRFYCHLRGLIAALEALPDCRH